MKEKGFTLLEIILSLSILGTIGVITINMLSNQIATRQKMSTLNADQHSLDAALNRITKDLSGAYLPDQKNANSLNLINRPVSPSFYLKNENLIFFTMSFVSYLNGSNQSNQAFIRYSIVPNPNDSKIKQLIRVTDTDFNENIEKEDVGFSQVLIEDLDSFRVEFWDGNSYRSQWNSQSSDTQYKLPKLVKVHVSSFSSEKIPAPPEVGKEQTRKTFALDTIVYLTNTQRQKEVTTPAWTEFKWQ